METPLQQTTTSGRRARNMQEKQERIFTAATTLFAEHGFEAVTVAEIADTADIAAGTLFRYATSKAELLLMVHNQRFREAIAAGVQDTRSRDDATAAVIAIIEPIVEFAAVHPGNVVVYQRELLFGSAGDRYRLEGLALVGDLERAIADSLTEAMPSTTPDEALRAARSVFAVLLLFLAQPSTGARWGTDAKHELHQQINQIVLGLRAAAQR